jgi:hypothetical protein
MSRLSLTRSFIYDSCLSLCLAFLLLDMTHRRFDSYLVLYEPVVISPVL